MKIIILLLSITLGFNSYAGYVETKKEMPKNYYKYKVVIADLAKIFKVNEKTLTALIWTESHFKARALSYKGASGLMQIMPETKKYIKKKYKEEFKIGQTIIPALILPQEVINNLILGTIYLKALYNRFGKEDHAIIAYNMGPTWVSRKIKRKKRFGYNHQYLKKIKKRKLILLKNYSK
jgi:soluble lytic murein transglycosylase-like protein